ncbi:hypothetical protein NPIL_581571 [Nephila pilipes]|uniref:Uncharacterized protein n=1 Tax=Nephila pilipes TaxID=299642 RepID=A0A8X6N4G6_NEPPI|nr:hypothetical protein NPIL_581571 [Nephila pilipes]
MVSQERCTSEQIATAVVLWSLPVFPAPVLCEVSDDCLNLKCLDLIISTVDIFSWGFRKYFENVVKKNYQELPKSKIEFLNFIKTQSLLLSEKNDCFHMFLTCGFFHKLMELLYFDFECCHFAKTASKCLSYILDSRFKEVLETDAGWESLMAFCRKMHLLAYRQKAREGDRSIFESEAKYECDIFLKSDLIIVKECNNSVDGNEIRNENTFIEEDLKSLSLADKNLINEELDNGNLTMEAKQSSANIPDTVNAEQNGERNLIDENVFVSLSVSSDENSGKIDSENLIVNIENEVTKEFQTRSCGSNIGIDKFIEETSNRFGVSTGNGANSHSGKSNDGMIEKPMGGKCTINTVSSDERKDLCSDPEQQLEADNGNSEKMIRSITETPEFLSEIKMLLLECEKNTIDKNFELTDCEIQVSDTEDMENITVCDYPKMDNSSPIKIVFKEKAIEDMKETICDNSEEIDDASEADESDEITDEDAIHFFFDEMSKPSEMPNCELCKGRASAFVGNWYEKFSEANKNMELISDVF